MSSVTKDRHHVVINRLFIPSRTLSLFWIYSKLYFEFSIGAFHRRVRHHVHDLGRDHAVHHALVCHVRVHGHGHQHRHELLDHHQWEECPMEQSLEGCSNGYYFHELTKRLIVVVHGPMNIIKIHHIDGIMKITLTVSLTFFKWVFMQISTPAMVPTTYKNNIMIRI